MKKCIWLSISLLWIMILDVKGQVLQNSDSSSSEKVQVFSNVDYFDDEGEWSNIIKINPLLIFRGEIPIYYERKLSDNFTAEVGAGVTLNDYLTTLFLNIEEAAIGEYEAKLGFTMKAAIKLFPGGEAPDDIYFSPEFRYKTHNYDYTLFSNYTYTGVPNSFRLNYVYTDIVALIGYQEEWDSQIYIDYYGGVGIRNLARESIRDESYYNSAGNFVPNYVKLTDTQLVPLLSLGVKIGFAF